jgi:hypothetical protein
MAGNPHIICNIYSLQARILIDFTGLTEHEENPGFVGY